MPASGRESRERRGGPDTGRSSDVVAEFDYDIRRIWIDGTPEDRAVLHVSHPDIVRHASRLRAYEKQFCAS
jgi:hypothetical protein